MVQDRKEPTFSSVQPERDEVASHQNRGPQATSTKNSSRPASGGRQAPPASSGLAVFALLLALIGIGGAGYSVWQLQLSQKNLISAESRIAELEGRLNLTSSESDQSVTAIHEKLKWADSEIRKLWGVANDINKKAIKESNDSIAKLNSELKTVAANAKTAKDISESQKGSLSSIKALSNEQQLVLTQLSDDIASAKKQIAKFSGLETKISSLDGLATRMKNSEEAIQAIDSFRRSANADIQQIKQQMAAP